MTDDTTTDPLPDQQPIRVGNTFVHGVHIVQRVSQRGGVLAPRGRSHLSAHGPVTLCGLSLDLSHVDRRDLFVSELVHPESSLDLCADCLTAFDPEHTLDVVAEQQPVDDAAPDLGKLGPVSFEGKVV